MSSGWLRAAVMGAVLAVAGSVLAAGGQDASAATTCNGTTLSVVAHMDDDLLFLSPDIDNMIAGGRCVRTVVLTAGDAGESSTYWLGREAGGRAAYNVLLGVPTSTGWTTGDAGIAGHPITLFTSNADSRVSLAFLRLPDGDGDGAGFASTGNQSLQKLYQGSISSISAIDGSTSYTKASLTTTIRQLMSSFGADTILTQDWVGSFGDVDHSDHHAAAYFTREAHQGYSAPHTAYSYEDYETWGLPQNVFGAELAKKSSAFYAYGAHDAATCSSAATCAGGPFETWLLRQYVKATETGGSASAPHLAVSASAVNVGSVTVGQSASATFTVSNTGTGPLTFSTVTGPAAPFSATGLPAVGSTLAAGASATVTARFSPNASGTANATISFVSNGGSATVALTGTGITTPPPPPPGGGGTIPAPTAGGWQLNGSAVLSGADLQLTAATADQRGSAFWPTAVSSAGLSISFDAVIAGGDGADGMTLTLANPTAGPTALGATGGGLGYAGIPGIAVTMDTWQNWGSNDPSSNFAGLVTGYATGNTDSLTYAATSTAVPSWRTATRRVVITTTTNRIKVTVDGVTAIDTALTLPPNVLVGFTAGTGGSTDRHAVRNVTITTA